MALGAGGLLAISLRPGTLEAVPCLLIAGCAIVTLFFARSGFFAMTALAAGATTTAALATFMIELHGPIDIVSGLALGTIAFHLAFSKPLFFLDRPSPWTGIEHELDNLWNLFVSNTRQKWERNYASGSWDFLNSPSQRGRHYAIAGIVADRHPDGGARVLDVGCGLGTLYPLLKGRVCSYSGLDLSEEVIKRCRSAFADDPNCTFASGAFEDFPAQEPFDVVVLNEVLYYFPVSRAVEVFQKALSHAGDDGFVVVSMNRSWKGRLIRARLNAISPPVQSLRITNLQTGSYWTVEVYSRAKGEHG
ncbi:MAG: class I SAM-dependent methyltransferase [Armatimonadota bacterium]